MKIIEGIAATVFFISGAGIDSEPVGCGLVLIASLVVLSACSAVDIKKHERRKTSPRTNSYRYK